MIIRFINDLQKFLRNRTGGVHADTAAWPRARIGAITIDLLRPGAVTGMIAGALAGDSPPAVLVSVNLDHIHHFAAAEVLPAGMSDGIRWLTLLDGHPVVSAVRRRGGMPAVPVPGSELLDPVVGLAAACGARIALVGGGAATRAYWRQELPRHRPGLVLAGTWGIRWADLDRPGGGAALAAEVARAGPSLLIVSLGKPRQELWLRDHMAATGARVAIAVGSAADYLAGTARRPPAWAREIGAEWLVRLVREPRRLGRRYLVQGPPALMMVRRQTRILDPPLAVIPEGG
jgi:exopolysaccharide biosynthesis WecB/TagA/CpsF family protein